MARRVRFALAAACATALCTTVVTAQTAPALDLGGAQQVGGEAERYVRAMQLVGAMPATDWSIRPLYKWKTRSSGATAPADTAFQPWRLRFLATADSSAVVSWNAVRPRARLVFNSSFAAPTNDGPTWAGRGMTGELQWGARAKAGPLHVEIAPLLFLSQNQSFALAPNGFAGDSAFRDARFPTLIDAPQRFGSTAYGRLDAGNSSAYVALPGSVVGVSSAAESWGPAREYPLVLSGTSGGFPHAFFGTDAPINLWIFQLHMRVLLGTLGQSDFSPIDTGAKKRWATAAVVSITPRGIPGLEIGGVRFVEAALPGRFPSLSRVKRLVSGTNVNVYANVEAENQLASAFFRWAFAPIGVELYGEYMKDDYTLSLRRFLQYPDDLRSYVLGLQHVSKIGDARARAFHVELVNAELSASNRGERGDLATRALLTPLPPYLHLEVKQGHTNNGLFLGSPDAYGGAAWRAGVDEFSERGRTSFTLERNLRLDWLPGTVLVPDATHPDVMYSVGAERMRFAGARDYTFALTAMFDMNRNLQAGHNVLNVRAQATVRGWR